MIYLAQVLAALEGFRSSVPISLIGGIIDRGFSDNDVDLLYQSVLSHDRLLEHCGPQSLLHGRLHLVGRDELNRQIQPPELRIGSALLWDYADKSYYLPDEFLRQSSYRWLNLLKDSLPGKQVLDIGCGGGWCLYHCHFAGAHAVGISSSLDDIQMCSSRGEEVYLMDQNLLDFDDHSFDIVWSHHALEHSIAPILAIREAARVLKPDRQDSSNGIFDLTVGIGRAPGHYYRFDQMTLENMLTDSGFTIDSSQKAYCGFSPEVHISAHLDIAEHPC
jgi:SAM-dependent methyltransferase